jgi:hypothetical protein
MGRMMAKIFSAARAEIVDHGNCVSLGQEPIRQMGTNKATSTGNKDIHRGCLEIEIRVRASSVAWSYPLP